MIEVQVPKDVSTYESPLIGPLTARQAVCVVAAAAVEYIYYLVISTLKLNLTMNTIVCLGMVFAVPILYMAIGKPYGMRPETYIYYYFIPSLLAPKDRPYVTKPTYETMLNIIEHIEQENEQKNGSNTKNKNGQKPKKKTNKNKKARNKQDIMYA